MQYPWATPGTKVICIRDKPWMGLMGGKQVPPRPGDVLPQFMQQYTIRETKVSQRTGRLMLLFEELRNPGGEREPGFGARFFRPLETLETETETRIKEPVE